MIELILILYTFGVIIFFIGTFKKVPIILGCESPPIFASFMTSLAVGLLWIPVILIQLRDLIKK